MLLSNKGFLVGLIICVLLVAGSLLYQESVKRDIREQEARTARFLQQLDTNKPSRAAHHAEPTVPEEAGQVDVPSVSDDGSETVSEPAVVLSVDDADFVDVEADMFAKDTSETDEVSISPYGVSPYGFGPFPEIPPDYPDQDAWSETRVRTMAPEHELLSRVRIKLWNEGTQTRGAVFKDDYGLVYPILDGVVYYKRSISVGPGHEGVLSRTLTSGETGDKYGDDIMEAIDSGKGIFPPNLTFYEFPDGGIDPYEFLGLSR